MHHSLVSVTLVAILCLSCGVAETVDDVVGPSREPQFASRVRTCPAFGSWLIRPRTPYVGEPVEIQVNVSDADTPLERLSFRWAAQSGAFTPPSATTTRFVCESEGYQTLSLVAIDDTDCERQLDLEINCFPRR
jgi:hypothetical protein